MPFHSTGPHYCPAQVVNRRNGTRRIDAPLKLLTSNYSGCGVDIATCPSCERIFQISYKVDEMIDVTEDVKAIQNGE